MQLTDLPALKEISDAVRVLALVLVVAAGLGHCSGGCPRVGHVAGIVSFVFALDTALLLP